MKRQNNFKTMIVVWTVRIAVFFNKLPIPIPSVNAASFKKLPTRIQASFKKLPTRIPVLFTTLSSPFLISSNPRIFLSVYHHRGQGKCDFCCNGCLLSCSSRRRNRDRQGCKQVIVRHLRSNLNKNP